MTIEYTPKTDEEIKQLAVETFSNQIFWATMAPVDLVGSIFMVLALCDSDHRKDLAAIKAIPYEYMDKAGPRSINDYPMFMSMQWINTDDYNRMVTKYNEIKEAVDKT